MSRDFVVVVAEAMVEYSLRGFCGVFNARIRVGGGRVFWVSFGVVPGWR